MSKENRGAPGCSFLRRRTNGKNTREPPLPRPPRSHCTLGTIHFPPVTPYLPPSVPLFDVSRNFSFTFPVSVCLTRLRPPLNRVSSLSRPYLPHPLSPPFRRSLPRPSSSPEGTTLRLDFTPPLSPIHSSRGKEAFGSCRTPTRRSFVTVSLTTPRRNFDKRKKKDTEDGGGGRRTPVEFSAPLEAAGNV